MKALILPSIIVKNAPKTRNSAGDDKACVRLDIVLFSDPEYLHIMSY